MSAPSKVILSITEEDLSDSIKCSWALINVLTELEKRVNTMAIEYMKIYINKTHRSTPSIITIPHNEALQAILQLHRSIDETVPKIFSMHTDVALNFNLKISKKTSPD